MDSSRVAGIVVKLAQKTFEEPYIDAANHKWTRVSLSGTNRIGANRYDLVELAKAKGISRDELANGVIEAINGGLVIASNAKGKKCRTSLAGVDEALKGGQKLWFSLPQAVVSTAVKAKADSMPEVLAAMGLDEETE
jgi:hypothetical protein